MVLEKEVRVLHFDPQAERIGFGLSIYEISKPDSIVTHYQGHTS